MSTPTRAPRAPAPGFVPDRARGSRGGGAYDECRARAHLRVGYEYGAAFEEGTHARTWLCYIQLRSVALRPRTRCLLRLEIRIIRLEDAIR